MAEPLDLADADGDRIRFAINRGRTDWPVEIWTGGQGPELDWRLDAALSIGQLAEILRWGVSVLGGEIRITGRPYTDEEALDDVRKHLEAIVPNAPAGTRLHVLANLAHARAAALERTLDVNAVLNAAAGRPYTDEELARTPSVRRDEILREQLAADAAASNPRNPDCVARKHAACSGDAWDEFADASVGCGCPCHNQHADPVRPALTDEQRQARS